MHASGVLYFSHPDGSISDIWHYVDRAGGERFNYRQISYFEGYYPQPAMEYYRSLDGKRHQLSTYAYSNRDLHERVDSAWMEGEAPEERVYEVRQFAAGGALTVQYTRINGQRDGLYRAFSSSSGKLLYHGYFLAGQETGRHESYREDSAGVHTLESRVHYQHGVLNGFAEYYRTSGVPESSGSYRDGLRHGLWSWYDWNGDLEMTDEWIDGMLFGQRLIYNGNRTPLIRESYVFNLLDGPYARYFSDGVLQLQGEYQDDLPVGTWRAYDTHGNLWTTLMLNRSGELTKITYRSPPITPTNGGDPYRHEYDAVGSGDGLRAKLRIFRYDTYYQRWYIRHEIEGFAYYAAGQLPATGYNAGSEQRYWLPSIDVRHGFDTEYQITEDGTRIWRKTPYVNGIIHGIEQAVYPHLWPVPTDFNRYEHGVLTDKTRVFEGGSREELEYALSAHGPVPHGRYTSYFADGSVWMEGRYSGGFPTGLWYSSGEVVQDYGPPQPLITPSGEALPDVPDSPTWVRLYGRITSGGKSVPYAEFSINNGEITGGADFGGRYEKFLDPGQQITLRVEHPDYLPYSAKISIGNDQALLFNIRLLPRPPAAVAGVNRVDSNFGNTRGNFEFFFNGIPFNNTYSPSINWNSGAVGTARWYANNIERGVVAPSVGGDYGFLVDVGAALTSSSTGRVNELKVVAWNADQVPSNAFSWKTVVMDPPHWLGNMQVEWLHGRRVYQAYHQFPQQRFSLLVSEGNLKNWLGEAVGGATWTLWGAVPLVGGSDFGLSDTHSSLSTLMRTDGTGTLQFGGNTGFTAFGQSLAGDIGGMADLRYVMQQGIRLGRSEFKLKVPGKLSKTVSVAELVPGFKVVAKLPMIRDIAQKLADAAQIEGSIQPDINLNLNLAVDANGELVFERTSGRLRNDIGLKLSSQIQSMKVELSGGGASQIHYTLPSEWGISGVDVTFGGSLKLALMSYELPIDFSHTFSIGSGGSPNAAPTPLLAPMSTGGFQPMRTDFAAHAGYNQRVEVTGSLQSMSGEIATPTAVDTLLYSVFPYAEPVMARNGDINVIVYVHYNPEQPIVRGTDINFMFSNGWGWSYPEPLTRDTRAEFAPQIAFDSEGRLVAVWQRVKDPAFPLEGSLEAMAAATEIVYAVGDFSGYPSWSSPIALSDNDVLDFEPRLSRDHHGGLQLLWQRNSGNQLIGDSNAVTTLLVAEWNTTTGNFNPPTELAHDFAHCQQFTFAHRGSERRIVWVRDTDADPSTIDDQELFMMIDSGSGWGSPTRLTDDASVQFSPQLFYPATGPAQLLWVESSDAEAAEIRQLMDWNSMASRAVVAGPLTPSFADFRLVADSNGNMLLAWQAISGAGSDLFARVFDVADEIWSETFQLTASPQREDQFRVLVADDAYAHGVFLEHDEDGDYRRMRTFVQLLGHDLALAPQSLRPLDPLLQAGDPSTLEVQVLNEGVFAGPDTEVDWFLGNPDAGGTLLGSSALSQNPLPGGASEMVHFAWTLPADFDNTPIVAVLRSASPRTDQNPANNRLAAQLLGMDLVAIECRLEATGDGELQLVATVLNDSFVAAAEVRVDFVDGNGRLLASRTLPTLLAGASAEIAASVTEAAFVDSNGLVLAVIDPDDSIRERSKANNSVLLPFLDMEDIDGDGLPDEWERHYIAAYPEVLISLASINPADDLDGDGLTNQQEFELGTNPLLADTDGDGMDDGWEWQQGFDPLDPSDAVADADSDGLSNLQEFLAGTDPHNPDTDGDGLSDYHELMVHATNPLLADSDADGLSDYAEIHLHGTNPTNPDSDSDGMSDGFEVLHGLNPLFDDSMLDADDDGLSNLQEYLAGTNPRMADSDADGFIDFAEVTLHFTDPLDPLSRPALAALAEVLPEAETGVPYAATLTAQSAGGPPTWRLHVSDYQTSAAAQLPPFAIQPGALHYSEDEPFNIDLPFAFPFFDLNPSSVWVDPRGRLVFSNEATAHTATIGIGGLAQHPSIAALWHSFDRVSTEHGVWIHATDDAVAFTWLGTLGDLGPDYPQSDVRFAVHLYPNGTIDFIYDAGNPFAGIVGISDGAGHYKLLAEFAEATAQRTSFRIQPIAGLPMGLRMAADGRILGTTQHSGTYSVAVAVDDGQQSATAVYTLIVSGGNDTTPVIVSYQPAESELSLDENSAQLFSVAATDPQEAELVYVWERDGVQVQVGTAATFLFSTHWGDAGNYTLTVKVSNAPDSTPATHSWQVYIRDDNDGDGLPNSWEILYGLNPNDASDASSDSDHDGYTALQEFIFATNPNDPASALRLEIESLYGTIRIRPNPASPIRSYSLWRSLDLDTWEPVPGAQAIRDPAPVLVDPSPSPTAIYRVAVTLD